jgi:hypothetical protein
MRQSATREILRIVSFCIATGMAFAVMLFIVGFLVQTYIIGQNLTFDAWKQIIGWLISSGVVLGIIGSVIFVHGHVKGTKSNITAD